MRPLAILLLLTALATAEDLKARVDAQAQPYIDGEIVLGMAIGLLDGDKSAVFGYGRVNAGEDGVPDGDTVYEIGSVSKVFTGILLADQVERERVRLDQPVETLLRDGAKMPRFADRQITLVDLSTHSSALPRMPNNFRPKDPRNPFADYSVDQLYDCLGSLKLRRSPGSAYAYSNLGQGLLGHALARQAGKSYEDLLIEVIAGPLNMESTRIVLTPGMKKRLAPGTAADLSPQANWDIPTLAGAGAIRSTVNDMLLFLRANLEKGESPLGKAMALALEQHYAKGKSLGLGWNIGPGEVRWHNGQTGGYHSFAALDPTSKRGIVILSNTAIGSVDALALALAQVAAGKTPEPVRFPKAVQVDRKILRSYAGRYQLQPNFVLTVTEEEGRLMVQATGQPKLRVFPLSDTKFAYRAVKAEILFAQDADGNVTGLVLDQHGRKMQAKRLP